MKHLFARPKPRVAARMAEGTRLYAIGDIHGRCDLLNQLHDRIQADASNHPDRVKIVVYLGDYVDRGTDSKGVIDLLSAAPLPDFDAIHLLGNHEDLFLRFLEDQAVGPVWVANGGDATLRSYGVATAFPCCDAEGLASIQRDLLDRLPRSHRRFLRSLALYHLAGDYIFVHAGLRPGIEIERQDPHDLLWIREGFLGSTRDHGRIVVHGHSIKTEIEFKNNRIGIDTGAFASGRLTCLVLDGADRKVIQTTGGGSGF
ncbi:MAG: metallophosphoesterase family protein [Sphingomonadales bacterium]